MSAVEPLDTRPAFYTADEVARILRIARPTVYQIARETPEQLGVRRWGRSVRFAREAIDRLVAGEHQ